MSARPSPRTDAEPWAFTGGEFTGGALVAWLVFLLLSSFGFFAVMGPAVVIAWVYTVPFSLLGLMLGVGPAFAIGTALRRHTAVELHVVVFGGFGLALGVAMTALALAVMNAWAFAPAWLIGVVGSAVAVPLGWAWGSRRARVERRDSILSRTPIESDALGEEWR